MRAAPHRAARQRRAPAPHLPPSPLVPEVVQHLGHVVHRHLRYSAVRVGARGAHGRVCVGWAHARRGGGKAGGGEAGTPAPSHQCSCCRRGPAERHHPPGTHTHAPRCRATLPCATAASCIIATESSTPRTLSCLNAARPPPSPLLFRIRNTRACTVSHTRTRTHTYTRTHLGEGRGVALAAHEGGHLQGAHVRVVRRTVCALAAWCGACMRWHV